jgi:hypothetical protein
MTMLDVGPVAPASTLAWVKWARPVVREFRAQPATAVSLPAQHLDRFETLLHQWEGEARRSNGTFRWQRDVDPDEVEYLLAGLHRLDTWLTSEAAPRSPAPVEGRFFYLVLVRALFNTLVQDGRSRAAFVDQLRCSWPSAVEAE